MTGTKDINSQKQDLRDELEKLKNEFKIELPKKIAEAREYGDLKENAEYHAARERQSFVQARIAQLTEQLNQLNDINVSDIPDDSIGFGSVVTVYDEIEEEELVFSFGRDITRQVQLQRSLQDSKNLYRFLMTDFLIVRILTASINKSLKCRPNLFLIV